MPTGSCQSQTCQGLTLLAGISVINSKTTCWRGCLQLCSFWPHSLPHNSWNDGFHWEATDLGNCSTTENLQTRSGEGGKGLLDPGSKRSPKSLLAPPKTSFAPVQPHFAPVQEASCSLGRQDLLHGLLTTFGNFPLSGSFVGPQLSKVTR